MKKNRTNNILETIRSFVADECPDLSVTEFLGYLIKRENAKSNAKLAKIGEQLYKGDTQKENTGFSTKEALVLNPLHATIEFFFRTPHWCIR